MYRFYADVAGAEIREIDYRPADLAFPLEELLEAIRPETRAILISNPNNPTGAAIGLDGLRQVLERAPQAAVLVDEAYFEFYGVTAIGELARYPNLFVSRTFSKIYGLAAMRIGCLFSQAANVAFLRKGQSPYSVNQVAALAVRAAIQDRDYVASYVKEILASRERIYRGFERMGIRYYPSQANFVLFHVGERCIEVRDKLRAVSVLVRDRSYEIAGCVRVTVGNAEQVERFFAELEKIW